MSTHHVLIAVGMAIASRKLKAVKVARSFYQVAKVYVNTEAGTPMKPHVEELKQTLHRKRKTKAKPAKAPTSTTVAPPATTQTIKA